MIIPVKCFTCGKVLADKYRFYLEEVRRVKVAQNKPTEKVVYLNDKNTEKTVEGVVLDSIGINNQCCRRHFITHVDIE